MKNAFIDLGAYRGTYINKFIKSSLYKPDFEIYAFECNPHLKNVIYNKGVTKIQKAAWIYDGELEFFVSKKKPELVQGSSVFKNKITGDLDKDHPMKVECIDFSQWLKTNFSPDDNILVKMNIEGAEYDILEKCVADGTIGYIKQAWIQWHWKKCGISEERHKALLSKINFKNGYEEFR